MFSRRIGRFLSFETVDVRFVLITALISYALQINAIVADEPLYLVALYTLLPWIPIVLFEGIWKVKNYTAVAFLGVFTILQLGHFGEHLAQVVQLKFLDGTVACPPPVDNLVHSNRAIEMGLREAGSEPTFLSVDQIIKPGPDGNPIVNSAGEFLTGPAACAVFGQLDLEIVHLIWELIGLFGTAGVLFFFRRNVMLWIAFGCLCFHALEHLTISYFYYFDQERVWEGFRQLWATYQLSGNQYVAYPAGKEPAMLNFYEAGGKFGLMAKNGMFELVTGFRGMPSRAELHMGYNLAITVPTVLGFLIELRRIKNRYLELSFSNLSQEDLSRLTLEIQNRRVKKGELIFEEGDYPDKAYIIADCSVRIVTNRGTDQEQDIALLHSGQLFGEMGILKPPYRRMASAIAESSGDLLELSPQTLKDLSEESGGTFQNKATSDDIRKLIEMRLQENASKTQTA